MNVSLLTLTGSLLLYSFANQQPNMGGNRTNVSTYPTAMPDSTTFVFKANSSEGHTFYLNTYYFESGGLSTFKNKRDTTIKIYFDKPVRLSIMDNLKISTTTYHILPGETVIFIKNSKKRTLPLVPYDSIRTNELTFFPAMNQDLNSTFEGFDEYKPKFSASSSELIQIADKLYKERLAFLDTYQKQHTISKQFIVFIKAKFKAIHYRNIIELYAFSNKKPDQLIEHFYTGNKPQAADSTTADDRGYAYVRYTANQEHGGETSTLIRSANVAMKDLSGATRDYTLFQLINGAFRTEPQSLPTLVKQYNEVVQNSSLLTHINARYKLLNMSETSKNYNQSVLISPDEKSRTWTNLLSAKKDKLVYIDFWASWCGPCRAEMPNSKKLKSTYTGKNIDFVYISTDDNPSAWKQAMNQIGIQNAENYILPKGAKSILAKELKINSIPRYILLKNCSILLSDAPRPGDSTLRAILDKELQ